MNWGTHPHFRGSKRYLLSTCHKVLVPTLSCYTGKESVAWGSAGHHHNVGKEKKKLEEV
jgi:hypothetical protein